MRESSRGRGGAVVVLAFTMLCAGCTATPPTQDGGAAGGSAGGSGGGSGGGAAGGDAGSPPTPADFCARKVIELCGSGARCGSYDSAAGCLELYARQVESNGFDSCTESLSALADGRVGYDGAAAQACLSLYASACDVRGTVCDQVFTATVPMGGSCFQDFECVTGTYCNSATTCPGTCQTRLPAGSRVTSSTACLEGLGITVVTLDGGNFELRCAAPPAQGEACSLLGPLACAAGLKCSVASTCAPAKPAGQACGVVDGGLVRVINDCVDGLLCQPSASGPELCGPPAPQGAACGTCQYDLRCAAADAGSRCMPKGLLGDSCRSSGNPDCARGFYCQPQSGPFGPGQCAAQLPLGGRCIDDSSCQPTLRCAQRAPPDGGIFPESVCVAGDGGSVFRGCADPTP